MASHTFRVEQNLSSSVLGGACSAYSSPVELYFGELITKPLFSLEHVLIPPQMESNACICRPPRLKPYQIDPGSTAVVCHDGLRVWTPV